MGFFADGKFIKFDAGGSAKAKDLVEKSVRGKDIQVMVEGVQNGMSSL